MKFFSKFFEFFKILNIKNRIKKMNGVLSDVREAKTSVKDIVDFENNPNSPKTKMELEIESILDECNWNPVLLLEFIKSHETPVHVFKFAGFVLDKVKEKEGFITPVIGLRALWLNLMINHKIAFETKPMFVISSIPKDIYLLIYEFFRWYGFREGLDGYDVMTQDLFKKVWLLEDDENLDKLSVGQMMKLKEAIARDFEAINFVSRLAQERGKKD